MVRKLRIIQALCVLCLVVVFSYVAVARHQANNAWNQGKRPVAAAIMAGQTKSVPAAIDSPDSGWFICSIACGSITIRLHPTVYGLSRTSFERHGCHSAKMSNPVRSIWMASKRGAPPLTATLSSNAQRLTICLQDRLDLSQFPSSYFVIWSDLSKIS